MTNIHVTKRKDGDWQVKKAGNKRPSSTAKTKEKAIKDAKRIGKKGDTVLVHNRNNAIKWSVKVR